LKSTNGDGIHELVKMVRGYKKAGAKRPCLHVLMQDKQILKNTRLATKF
jgi:hypothetical protein